MRFCLCVALLVSCEDRETKCVAALGDVRASWEAVLRASLDQEQAQVDRCSTMVLPKDDAPDSRALVREFLADCASPDFLARANEVGEAGRMWASAVSRRDYVAAFSSSARIAEDHPEWLTDEVLRGLKKVKEVCRP